MRKTEYLFTIWNGVSEVEIGPFSTEGQAEQAKTQTRHLYNKLSSLGYSPNFNPTSNSIIEVYK